MTAEQPTILITDDDDGHAFLIEENLRLSGLRSIFLRFNDGEEVLQFLQGLTTDPAFQRGKPYVLLLEAREGAPFPIRPGVTLVIDPELIGSGQDPGPLAEAVRLKLIDLLQEKPDDARHDARSS